jgi:SM-20-related protein
MMPDFSVFALISAQLEAVGYVVVEDFLDAAVVAALSEECAALDIEGGLSSATIGRGAGRAERQAIRGDRTAWFECDGLSPTQHRYWSRMNRLRESLNRSALLGLSELEAHYALYPIGARYARHRDRFRDDDSRVVSSVLYLNRAWRDEHGGALRLYFPAGSLVPHVDIYPRAGTLVLFLSAEFEHEVLPALRERRSIAGWMRRGKPG